MAKLGFFKKRPHPDETENKESGLAYQIPNPSMRLLTIIGSSFFNEPKFYEGDPPKKENDEINLDGLSESAQLIIETAVEIAHSNQPRDLLALANWARSELHIRTTPQILLAVAAYCSPTKSFVRKYTPLIIQRADELRQVFAAYDYLFGRPFPNALKRGLADAFRKFDEYSLLKYNSRSHPTFRDLLLMIERGKDYPVPSPLFEYLVNRRVVDPEQTPILAAQKALGQCETFDETAKQLAKKARATWEMVLSQFGNEKEVWEALIPQMGYMALLRNLRNMVWADISEESARKVAGRISDPEEVQNSRQLPFRFYSAYQMVVDSIAEYGHTPRIFHIFSEAVVKALEISGENLPRFPGKTIIFCDNSGSMDSEISERSWLKCSDVANILGAMAHKVCDTAYVYAFATEPAAVHLSQHDSIITNMKKINTADTQGYSTEAWKCIRLLLDQKIFVDRIILLSDMQCYTISGNWRENLAHNLTQYRQKINPKCILHSVDLEGYGTAQMPEDDPLSNLVSGFSEKILSHLVAFENDGDDEVEDNGYLPTIEQIRAEW